MKYLPTIILLLGCISVIAWFLWLTYRPMGTKVKKSNCCEVCDKPGITYEIFYADIEGNPVDGHSVRWRTLCDLHLLEMTYAMNKRIDNFNADHHGVNPEYALADHVRAKQVKT